MFVYQEEGRFAAQVAGGVEEIAADEIFALGGESVQQGFRVVTFAASPEALMRIVYRAALPARILAPLARFGCHDGDYLRRRANDVDWTSLMTVDETFAVRANVSNSNLSHSQFAALCVKDALVDQFRAKMKRRPSVEKIDPDVWIHVHVDNDRATLALDLGCGALHRRGYRRQALEAPLTETLAAAMLRLSDWKGERPLLDPMCGAGTILAEALMLAGEIPSAFLRKRFGFPRLPEFSEEEWTRVRGEEDARIKRVDQGLITGSDRDPEAIKASERNLAHLPGSVRVDLKAQPFQSIEAFEGVIVTNPPYGVRLGDRDQAAKLLKEFGDFLKQKCRGSEAYIYVGDKELVKSIGLKTSWKKPLRNGALDGRLMKLELY